MCPLRKKITFRHKSYLHCLPEPNRLFRLTTLFKMIPRYLKIYYLLWCLRKHRKCKNTTRMGKSHICLIIKFVDHRKRQQEPHLEFLKSQLITLPSRISLLIKWSNIRTSLLPIHILNNLGPNIYQVGSRNRVIKAYSLLSGSQSMSKLVKTNWCFMIRSDW